MMRPEDVPNTAATAAFDQAHAAAVDLLSSGESFLVIVERKGELLVTAGSHRTPEQLFLAQAAKAAAGASSDSTSDLFSAVEEYLRDAGGQPDGTDADDDGDLDSHEDEED